MKLLLVDDHVLFLEGLHQLLTREFTSSVVLVAPSVAEAQNILELHDDIDLVLVDLNMPDVDGLSLIKTIKQNNPVLPTVGLSASENFKDIQTILDAGALGFIPKTYSSERLVSAISKVTSGETYVPKEIKYGLTIYRSEQLRVIRLAEEAGVTERQIEILSMIEQGFSNLTIANKMYISEHTVKSHLKQVFQKLDVSNRIESINKAKQLGLL